MGGEALYDNVGFCSGTAGIYTFRLDIKKVEETEDKGIGTELGYYQLNNTKLNIINPNELSFDPNRFFLSKPCLYSKGTLKRIFGDVDMENVKITSVDELLNEKEIPMPVKNEVGIPLNLYRYGLRYDPSFLNIGFPLFSEIINQEYRKKSISEIISPSGNWKICNGCEYYQKNEEKYKISFNLLRLEPVVYS